MHIENQMGFSLHNFISLIALCVVPKNTTPNEPKWVEMVACPVGFLPSAFFYTQNKEGWGRPLGPSPRSIHPH